MTKLILLVPIGIFLFLFLLPSNLKAAVKTAPFLPTPKRVIRMALRAINLKKDELLFDLGSGTGKALIIGEKEFGANGIGYEMGITYFVWSKINLFLHRTKKIKVFQKDFYTANLSNVDVMFMFLTPRAFVKLQTKFNNELKPGCRVITFSSPLGFWQPNEIISVPDIKEKLFLYIKK